MKILGKIGGALAVVALLAGAASAQQQRLPAYGETTQDKTNAEIAAEKEADKAYRRSLGNIPEQKSSDPWGTVRSDSSAQKADKAQPSKPKAKSADTKTGNAAK